MIEGIRFSELEGIQELKGTEMIPIVDGNENKKLKADKIATKKDISAFATKEDVDNKNKEQDEKLRTLEENMGKVDVVDDLTTGGSDKALSAEQGKKLNIKIEGGDDITPIPWIKGSTLSQYQARILDNVSPDLCRTEIIYLKAGQSISCGKTDILAIGYSDIKDTSVSFKIKVAENKLGDLILEHTYVADTDGYYVVGTKTRAFETIPPVIKDARKGIQDQLNQMKKEIENAIGGIDFQGLEKQVFGPDYIIYPEIKTGRIYSANGGNLITGKGPDVYASEPVAVKKGDIAKCYSLGMSCAIGWRKGTDGNFLMKAEGLNTADKIYHEYVVEEDGYLIFSSKTEAYNYYKCRIYKLSAVTTEEMRLLLDKHDKILNESLISIRVNKHAHFKMSKDFKILLYGTSLSSKDLPGVYYKELLEDTTGATVFNEGISGASASGMALEKYLDRIWNNESDLIIMEALANDEGKPGTIGSFDGSVKGEPIVQECDISKPYDGTYAIQAIDYIVRRIQAKYYNLKERIGLDSSAAPSEEQTQQMYNLKVPYLILCTTWPEQRGKATWPFSLVENHIRKRNCIVEVCNKNKIQCCDTYKMLADEIDMSKEPFYEGVDLSYTNKGIYYIDGVHLNKQGYKKVVRMITAEFM